MLSELDLTVSHGVVGTTGTGAVHGIRLAPEDQARFREDRAAAQAALDEATMSELEAFIRGRGRIPCKDSKRADLATHAFCLIMIAWWPERVDTVQCRAA